MAIPKKIIEYLKKNKIKVKEIAHKTVYTAFDLSKTLKEKLNRISKTLVIKTDKGYVLVMLPADRMVDFVKLKKILGAKKIEIAKEKVMKDVFKIKPGTMTPFATLHKKVPLYIDKALIRAKEILVSTGSYTDSLRLKISDLMKVEKNHTKADISKKR
ncbi:MAG: YbaK/EbsC family protein [Bacteroidetes bacterium]|nr:YbaK/EbsC family protein [Bacteroidota bacterium]